MTNDLISIPYILLSFLYFQGFMVFVIWDVVKMFSLHVHETLKWFSEFNVDNESKRRFDGREISFLFWVLRVLLCTNGDAANSCNWVLCKSCRLWISFAISVNVVRLFVIFSFSLFLGFRGRKELRDKETYKRNVIKLFHSINANKIDPSRVIQLSWQPRSGIRVYLFYSFSV